MQISAVGGDDASRTNTPLSALSFILESAVLTAESWVNGLELEPFPRDAEDWDQISAHPSISDGWRWENWDDFRRKTHSTTPRGRATPSRGVVRARLGNLHFSRRTQNGTAVQTRCGTHPPHG